MIDLHFTNITLTVVEKWTGRKEDLRQGDQLGSAVLTLVRHERGSNNGSFSGRGEGRRLTTKVL